MNWNQTDYPVKAISRHNVETTATIQHRLSFSGWLLAGLLALATLLLYWPVMGYDFINFDDNLYVTENVRVQQGLTWAGIKWAFLNPLATNWNPLTVLTHMLVCQCCGLQPWAHHLVNVLLHTANAVLVFIWLRQLTGAKWRSLLVAALFAFHPLRIESVAWITERKDVLSGFFGLLTLICYTCYAKGKNQEAEVSRQNQAGQRAKSIRLSRSSVFYLLCLTCFALGLMSKAMLVTLPFVLLLLDFWPLNRFSISDFRFSILKKLLLEKIPFFCLSILDSVMTLKAAHQSGALESYAVLSLGARIGNALVSYCRYLEKTFWPMDLAVFYPHPERWPLVTVVLAGVVLLALAWLFFRQWQSRPCLLTGWLWFCGMLVPVIGLNQAGDQAMADRFTYFPSLGLLVLLVWGVSEITTDWRCRAWLPPLSGLTAIFFCIVSTWLQLGYWRNSETLFGRALAVTTNNYLARNNLGEALASKGRIDEAIGQFREAIRLEPNYPDAQNNLGIALGTAGQTDEAIHHFKDAIRLKPGFVDAHYDLGVALDQKGQFVAAMLQYQGVIRLEADNASAWNNLGIDLARLGRVDEAIGCFQEAIRLKPDYAEARSNLSRAMEIKAAPPSR